MCRERNREPAWVAAVRLALLEGRVDVEGVMAEANLRPGRERTVRDVLETMHERGLLRQVAEDPAEYVAGRPLLDSAPSPDAAKRAAAEGVHRWARPAGSD